MKTTVKELDYEKVMALPQYPHLHPVRPGIFWREGARGGRALRGSAKKGGAGARDSCVASWVRGVADAFIEGVPGDAFALRGR